MDNKKNNFTTLLNQYAQKTPDSTVLYDVEQSFTYADLACESERVAKLLIGNGAKPGDSLALWLPTCSAWLSVYFACARLGITVVAMNTRFRAHEVSSLIERVNCNWLVLCPEFKNYNFAEMLKDIEPKKLNILKGIVALGSVDKPSWLMDPVWINYEDNLTNNFELPEVPAENTPMLIYTTSGTTSLPKLVLHTQRSLLTHGLDVAKRFGMDAKSKLLLGAPLCGAFGFSQALGALCAGSTMISSPILDPKECYYQIKKFQATHCFANNELLDKIFKQSSLEKVKVDLSSLQVVGFASFAPSLGDFVAYSEQCGINLIGLYGSSELQALVASQNLDAPLERRQLAGGKLTSPLARVRARDPESGEILSHGELGEIEINAPSLMREYLSDADATNKAIDKDGFFHTGDLGYTLSEQEFIYTARRGDFLRLGGFLVNPQEIQDYIETLEGIKSCQVVAATDKGKLCVVAFVIPTGSNTLNESDIISISKKELAGYKVPKKVCFVSEFPVVESANSNKINRVELQKRAELLLTSN